MTGEETPPFKPNPEPLLLRAIEAISGELELRPLLERIVRHVCELVSVDKGMMGLVDEPRRLIRIEAVYQMPDLEQLLQTTVEAIAEHLYYHNIVFGTV
jgi:hypothetical protein